MKHNSHKRKKKGEKKEKRLMEIVATTSLPAVNRWNADRWNAARSCQEVCLKMIIRLNPVFKPFFFSGKSGLPDTPFPISGKFHNSFLNPSL